MMTWRRLFYLLLLILLVSKADATGSLSIPNTFATQSGNIPVSQLDTNLSTIASYINNREITIGLSGARPSAGTSGRYYLETDVGGGTFFVDTGTAWVQVSPGVTAATAPGTYTVRNLVGVPNSAASTTQTSFSADLAILRNPTTGGVTVFTSVPVTAGRIDQQFTGGAVVGCDQAAEPTSGTFVHWYFTASSASTNPQVICSATAPPTGPSLPTGWVSWAYLGAQPIANGEALIQIDFRGSQMYYRASQNVVNGGSATGGTAVSVASFVSANALSYGVHMLPAYPSGNVTDNTVFFELVAGTQWGQALPAYPNTTGAFVGGGPFLVYRAEFPNVSQQFYYYWAKSGGSLTAGVVSFKVPNGGD